MLAYDTAVEFYREILRKPPAVRAVTAGVATLFTIYMLLATWWIFTWLLGPPGPVGIAGRVTYAGTPVEQGAVAFEPESFQGQRREVLITLGDFAVPQEAGLRPNETYRVRIRGFRKTGRKYENADMSKSSDEEVQYLPERYNASSELTVTTDRDRVGSGIQFDLMP